jgi:hypothetical protein
MTVMRTQIRDAVVSCLKGQTSAGNAVWVARDWPSTTDTIETGQILVFALRERKDRLGKGPLSYTTTATIEVIARIARGGPETALDMIDALAQQIAALVICNMPLRQLGIQYAPTVDTELAYGSEGEMAGVGQAKIDFGFEYPERYQPGGVPLVDIQVNEGAFGSFHAPLPQ